ncbi:MAG TPA: response regulator [Verrucomicrobiae bacterium]
MSAMSAEATASAAPRVLVIDDNLIIQRTLYFQLRDHGYQVQMAGNIATGMSILRREKMDLLLLDLSFPMDAEDIGCVQQDGFFLLDWFSRTPDVSKPPIIIISSTEPAQYSQRAAAAAVSACLHKPMNKEALLSTVQSVLGGSPTSLQAYPV